MIIVTLSSPGAALDYTATACDGHFVARTATHMVAAARSTEREAPFCRVVAQADLGNATYNVSIDIKNWVGSDGGECRSRIEEHGDAGTLGVMYNVRDSENYDFVVFRSVGDVDRWTI